MSPIRLSDLAKHLGVEIVGEGDPLIEGFAYLDQAKPTDLSFITGDRKSQKGVETSQAAAFLVPVGTEVPGKPVLPCESIWDAYNAAAGIIYPERQVAEGIHPTAIIDPSAELGADVRVGPGTVIESGAKIGAGTVIDARVFIGQGAVIGENCTLNPNVIVKERCVIGNRVAIHGGAVIGADGFRYEASPRGLLKIRQAGIVVIEDDVEIGANACIDRAGLGETRIGHGTKIDNLVQVGHNVTIGQHCILVSQVGIAGSTEIGNGVQIGGQVGISGHLTIGDGVTIAAQSGIIANIAPGRTVMGTPAMDAKSVMRFWSIQAKLINSKAGMAKFKQMMEQFISECETSETD